MQRVSVVIPVYNAAKTLARCLESVFNQQGIAVEVIAVNDGSRDESIDILSRYKQRITIINQTNHGAAHARNQGAKVATAAHIIFVDADTMLATDMLQTMLNALTDHPEASYAYSQFKFGWKTFTLWPFDAVRLKTMPYIHTTSLIKRKCFPGFDVKLKRFQDWDLWLTMLTRGYTGVYVARVLFTVAPGGTMSRWLPKIIYKIPFLPAVRAYRQAELIVKRKHQL